MNHLVKLQGLAQGHKEVYPGQIQEIFDMATTPGSDICEHVATMVEYGKQCGHITEFGVRFGWSTRSFLFAQPKKLVSVDLYEWNSVHQCGMAGPLTLGSGNTQYKRYKELYKDVVEHVYIIDDTMKTPVIESTDLLFIDTLHHRDCVKVELERHGNQATKWIMMHDTETFGRAGQGEGSLPPWNMPLGPGTGLLDGLEGWLAKNPHWKIKQHFINNNGLTILERQ